MIRQMHVKGGYHISTHIQPPSCPWQLGSFNWSSFYLLSFALYTNYQLSSLTMAYNVFSSSLSINSVLVILLTLAVALACPINQTILNSPKVFVVGLPQTGTKSVGDALEKFSFRRPELKDFYSQYLYYMFSANYTAPLICERVSRCEVYPNCTCERERMAREHRQAYPPSQMEGQ